MSPWLRRSSRPRTRTPVDSAPEDHEDAWWDSGDLVGMLRRAGHQVTVTDVTDTPVPAELQGHVQSILRESVEALLRRARCPQRLRLRIRIDSGDLILSMQSSGRSADNPGIERHRRRRAATPRRGSERADECPRDRDGQLARRRVPPDQPAVGHRPVADATGCGDGRRRVTVHAEVGPLPAASGDTIRSRRLAVASRRSRPAAHRGSRERRTHLKHPPSFVQRDARLRTRCALRTAVRWPVLTDARRAHEPSDHHVPVAPPSYEVARAVAPEHTPYPALPPTLSLIDNDGPQAEAGVATGVAVGGRLAWRRVPA